MRILVLEEINIQHACSKSLLSYLRSESKFSQIWDAFSVGNLLSAAMNRCKAAIMWIYSINTLTLTWIHRLITKSGGNYMNDVKIILNSKVGEV